MIDSRELPPHLRQDPSVMTARLDTHRRTLDDHEQRLSRIEQAPAPMQVDTPIGKLPLPLVIAALMALIAMRPDLVVSKLLP